jgi:soluble lytic murein transglycosylase-like protein
MRLTITTTKSLMLAFALGMLVQGSAHADIFGKVEDDGAIQLSNHPTTDGFEAWAIAPKQQAASGGVTSGVMGRGDGIAGLGRRYQSMVEQAARSNELEPALLHAVIAVESHYNPKAVSRKGASGLMQLMPDTAKRYGVSDILDPAQNISAGAQYLRDLLKMFNNDVRLALAAYNAGENAVVRFGKIPPYQETVAYVPKVLAFYKKLGAGKDI